MATTTPHAPATYFLQVFAYLCYYTASYIFLGLLLYRVTDLNAFVAAGTKARHSLSDARVSLLLLGLLMLISMGGVAVYWNVPLGSNFFFSLWMLGVWLGHLFIVLASFRACRFKGSLYTLTALQFLYAAVGILALCVPWDYSQQTLAAVFASFINVMLALNATSSLDFILQLHSAAEWTPADAEQELTVHANDCGEDDAVLLVSSG
ncbi:hypothetical protein BC830DRAFT_384493 [Chytriomyces sp. MP71]|nr:hypothetical protein BC830DRAFT_384493 [Chytriomyces sp. MP71]